MSVSCLRAAGLALSAAAILTACDPQKPAPVPSGPAPTPSVAVVRLKPEKATKVLRLTAELQAYRSVALYPKVPGFLEWIGVDRGSRVKAGEVLVRLIAPEIAAQKQEAEAKLAGDEATYRRLKEASATPGVVAGNDLDVAARMADASRARVRVLSEQLCYLQLHAPFDGVVTERNAHEGSFVGPPSGAAAPPVVRLQEQSKLRLTVAVPELAAGEVPVGKKVEFAVAAFPGETFSGTVARSASSLEVKTRTLPVELDVDNSGGRLTPGMFAEVLWPMERAKPSYFVPPSCIAVTTERSFVVRVRDGVAEWVDVKAGFSTADRIEIFGNLQEGDLVALRGTDELKAGTKVRVQEGARTSKP